MPALAGALEHLARHAARYLAGAVLLGVFVPPLADLFRPVLPLAILATLVLSLLRVDFADVLQHARQPFAGAIVLVFLLIVSPLAVWLVAGAVGLPAGLVVALVLMAAAPPIASAPAFALILGLDAAFAVYVVVICHVVMPVTLPILALHLLDLDLQIGFADLSSRLVLLIGLAFAIAWGLKRWLLSPTALAAQAARIDGLAVIGLLAFALGIMAGVTDRFLIDPGFVLLTIAVAFIANASLQAFGALCYLARGRRRAFTVGLMAGNCNMGLILAALGDKADIAINVFFAMAQLPMYMLPMLVLPIYRRLL